MVNFTLILYIEPALSTKRRPHDYYKPNCIWKGICKLLRGKHIRTTLIFTCRWIYVFTLKAFSLFLLPNISGIIQYIPWDQRKWNCLSSYLIIFQFLLNFSRLKFTFAAKLRLPQLQRRPHWFRVRWHRTKHFSEGLRFCSSSRPFLQNEDSLISCQLTSNKAFKRGSSFYGLSRPYLQNEDPMITYVSVDIEQSIQARVFVL